MVKRATDDSRDRIRLGHDTREDAVRHATTVAYRAIASGEYRGERRYRRDKPAEPSPAPRAPSKGAYDTGPTPTAEQVRARWDREAVVPGALARPCPEHGANVGMWCFSTAKGVCGLRVHHALTSRRTTP